MSSSTGRTDRPALNGRPPISGGFSLHATQDFHDSKVQLTHGYAVPGSGCGQAPGVHPPCTDIRNVYGRVAENPKGTSRGSTIKSLRGAPDTGCSRVGPEHDKFAVLPGGAS